ncbi:MAG: hypothetical protein ACI33N_08345 [Desulfovibrionaceae bacterium]
MSDNKSTGWKVPLLFCLGIGAVTALGILLRPPQELPELRVPPSLMQAMRARKIDLAASEEGRRWQGEITAAAGGFADATEKDARILRVLDAALEAGRFDAACTASVLLHDAGRRDAALVHIAEAGAEQCPGLVWAGMAAAGLRSPELRRHWEEHLTRRWAECGGER